MEVSSLRSQDVVWNHSGLFFSDPEKDYWINSNKRVEITGSSKANVGDGVVSIADGRKTIGFYNNGFTGKNVRYDEFDEQVVISSVDGSERKSLGKWLNNFSVCEGDVVYGVGLQADPNHLDALECHPELMKIFDGGVVSEVIAQKRAALGSMDYGRGNLPCRDNKIYMISHNAVLEEKSSGASLEIGDIAEGSDLSPIPADDGPAYFFALEVWDVKSGQRKVRTLSDGKNEKFKSLSNEETLNLISISDHSLKGDYLYWSDGSLYVNRTNIQTGVTDRFSLNGFGFNIEETDMQVEFRENYIYIFAHGLGDDEASKKSYLVTFDMNQNKEVGRREISGLFEKIGKDQTISGFAVNPDESIASAIGR